jgi:hypothetical protein
MKTFYLLLVFLACCAGSGCAGWYFGKESGNKDQQLNMLGGRVMQMSKDMGEMQKLVEAMAMQGLMQMQQGGGRMQIK